jgi:hypothetical protein
MLSESRTVPPNSATRSIPPSQFPRFSFHADGRRMEVAEWPLVRSLVDGVSVTNKEITVEFADGWRSLMRISSAPVTGPDAQVIGAVAICEDITKERAQAEERMQVCGGVGGEGGGGGRLLCDAAISNLLYRSCWRLSALPPRQASSRASSSPT